MNQPGEAFTAASAAGQRSLDRGVQGGDANVILL